MTDEKPLFEPDKKLEPIPDFTAMPFEELMSTDHIPDDDVFNNALWREQSERYKKLNIAPLDDFKIVDECQDEIIERLNKLEDKFELLTKLIDKSGIFEVPRPSLAQYLEDLIK